MTEQPLDKLDWFVQHRVNAEADAGMSPNAESIAKETAGLLSEMDKAIAFGDITPRRRSPLEQRTQATKDNQLAESLAEQAGGKFFQRELPEVDPVKAMPALTGVDKQRHVAMMKRVTLLTSRSKKRRLRYGIDPIDAADFEYRELAMEIIEETLAMNHGATNKGGVSYSMLSKNDRDRVYFAAIERICDRSNGAVGVGWWVTR